MTTIFSSFPVSLAHAAVDNVLRNAGFELALGGGENWDNTANRGISRITVGAPEGAAFLRLDEADLLVGTAGAFTFQTVEQAETGDFVTFSGLVRVNSIDGGDAAQLRIEFQNENGGLIDGTNIASQAAVTAGFVRTTTSAFAPQGTKDVTFTIRIQPAAVGGTTQADFDSMEATISRTPILLQAGSNNGIARPGTLNAVALRVENRSATALQGVEIVANAQPGLHIHRSNATLDGKIIPQHEGSVVFEIGSLNPGQQRTLVFFVILTSGALPGRSYELELRATSTTGPASNSLHILFRAELDPVFDEGTVIGKVFNDLDRNGTQDAGELGVPAVRLMTEEGIVVITDQEGRYHIPGVKPGRHLIKIDAHTLPEGTEFVTEESYLFKTTPGIMNKVNFAVLLPPSAVPQAFQDDLNVTVTQGLDMSQPKLDVQAEPNLLKLGYERFEKEPVFRFSLNYPEFVKTWYLEIRDPIGQKVWTGFGVGAPPAEVVWSGQTDAGVMVKPGFYAYQFKVQDPKGREDWTVRKFLRILSKTDSASRQNARIEIPPVGDFNILHDGKQSIPLVAKPTLRVQGKTKPDSRVSVNGYPVTVDEDSGQFQTEFYVTPGEKEVEVVATASDGESTSYRQKVTVKDSTFFMVALGEEELGVNFQDGNAETVAAEDRFKAGFYEDGRLSFYLRGKLRGKFLVKAHYDTGDKRDALFTNLDPDDYYPVYGDDSIRDYEAQDTLDRLFVVVEMDRSFAKWGSFKTVFTDTELATYNRTLNGLKIHHETLSSTAYGDPKRGFTLFWSEASHRSDHNEFLATGGVLYYLRNRGVIEGSEKIRVETRDKIQGMSVDSADLIEGKDYEIDYDQGRILLSKPISSVAASDTLVSTGLLDGNPVYLIVDYEYDAGSNAFTDSDRGIRGYTHFGSHLRVGATAVEEVRRTQDYDLRAVDARFRFGRDTQITAEYAETKLEQTDHGVSFNGGLSFADLNPISIPGQRERENAYLIKAESQPVKGLELAGFLQGVEPGFSTERIRSQEGTKKYGISAKYRLTDYFSARYRFDSSELADQLSDLQEKGVVVPFVTYRAHTTQLSYDDGKYLGDLEYRRQFIDLPPDPANLSPTLLTEVPFENGFAGKLGYRLNERIMPYGRFQVTTQEKPDHQFGGGLRYEVTKNLFTYMEQMIGNLGDSLLFGFEQLHENGARSYANLRSVDRGIGSRILSTTIGSSYALSKKSRVYSERRYSNYDSTDGFADIVGYEGKLTERWSVGARFERSHLDNSTTRLLDNAASRSLIRTNTFNTYSATTRYESKKVRFRSYWEWRRDQDAPKMGQWLGRHYLEAHLNEDLRSLTKLDFGKARFQGPEDIPASFLEFDTGLAYRPVKHDRLNWLARYTFIYDTGSDVQFDSDLFGGLEIEEQSHIVSLDMAYDIHRYFGWVEKFAYKNSVLDTSLTDELMLHNFLWAHRLNFHVTRKWDLALEYRNLWQSDAAKTFRQGALVEVDRELYDYVRLGAGYNFSDFDDEIRTSNRYDSHGPFLRMSGKF